MDNAWDALQSAMDRASDCLWNDFAKEGREGDVLIRLARFPEAAAWLAESMSRSTDSTTRKLAAMLAGWIQQPSHASLLSKMLDRERTSFRDDSSSANSVGEDIMFAATRWTMSEHDVVRAAGVNVLAGMIDDALKATPWNTVHWATANLYQATDGRHPIFARLMRLTDEELSGQRFFQNVVNALQQNDVAALKRSVTLPPDAHPLSASDPDYPDITRLLNAAALAEAAGHGRPA